MNAEAKKTILKRAFDAFMEDYIVIFLFSLGVFALFLFMLSGQYQ